MKRFFSIIICFIIFNCIHFSVEARRNYVSVYDLNGKETNQVSITISELIWKNNNDYTLTVDSELKRPISIEPLISENAKDYEQVIIMDFKTDDAENPYPEIESMDVAIKHPIPSGGWRLLGKDYRLMYFFEDTVEDLSANITDSDENEVNFTVDKLGKYVIYLNPRVYDLIFYDGEPIPIDEEEYIMPGIYYEIEEISKEEFVVFPEIPKKDGYVFTGWKAWSGSGIYYINT